MFPDINITDIIDIAFMSFLIYIILVWFQRSRAAFVFTGMLIVAAIYLLAQQFGLVLTTWVFHGFFAVILIAVVVIFQEEIRRFFEQVAVWSMNPRLRRQHALGKWHGEIDILTRTMIDLAREKIGAIIVLRGKNMILGHLDGGTDLGGKLSEPLLKSIFDPHSIGHDGAVILEDRNITQFGAHLPLSKNVKKLGYGGTRHAAALGLSEMTDALCLVVSEERGTMSAMRHGTIRELTDAETLSRTLERFYHEIRPEQRHRSWHDYIRRNIATKVTAILLASLLWFVQVYGSKVIYKTFRVPVQFAELPSHLELVELDPEKVRVTLSGPRRSLTFLTEKKIQVMIKTLGLGAGTRTVGITGADLNFPTTLKLEQISPSSVKVKVEQEGAEDERG